MTNDLFALICFFLCFKMKELHKYTHSLTCFFLRLVLQEAVGASLSCYGVTSRGHLGQDARSQVNYNVLRTVIVNCSSIALLWAPCCASVMITTAGASTVFVTVVGVECLFVFDANKSVTKRTFASPLFCSCTNLQRIQCEHKVAQTTLKLLVRVQKFWPND